MPLSFPPGTQLDDNEIQSIVQTILECRLISFKNLRPMGTTGCGFSHSFFGSFISVFA